MKQILFFLLSLLFFTSCQKAVESEDSNDVDARFSQLRTNYAKLYIDEPPYAADTDALTGPEADLEYSLDDSLMHSDAPWTYYDSKYSDTLHYGIQQHIAWIILSQKDLIGLAGSNPSNATYQAVLKKYIDNLVKNKYSGYCLLYSALEKVTDTAYQKEKAKAILAYGKNDTLFTGSKEDFPEGVQEGLQTTYSFLKQLKVMAGE
ncbi:hypothetical protein AAEO56_17725 [Flavobacterium sp. DGU11]|uniref:Uncharacterized protein n=1 Tax=Flavobacterium arundinis TaxID=3139143 RepID=A0ABU9I115_9FLAO